MSASKLATELRQKKPFPSVRAEAVVSLSRTADVVHRFMDAAIEPHAITRQQYNVLRILRGAGCDGLPTLEIAERMVERTPGITRLVDRLIAKGLVNRVRCSEDRRVVYCRIDQSGLDLLELLDAPLEAASRKVFSQMKQTEQKALVSLLDKVRAGCRGTGQET